MCSEIFDDCVSSGPDRPRVLVAGIGNIFEGDDAFGCEVVRELGQRAVPEGVEVIDFGIRGYDLAYALADDYAAVILVDAAPRGAPPGTVHLIEPDLERINQLEPGPVDAHNLDPVRVLQMAQDLGARPRQLYLVGCEPAVLECDDGHLGLSERVRQAVPRAMELIESLIAKVLGENKNTTPGLVPV